MAESNGTAPSRSRLTGGPGRNKRAGQTLIEFALLYTAVIIPLTFGIIYVAQMYWVWHSASEFTREGARYAATHCWEPDGQNVLTYMQSHVPVNIDLNQFQTGGGATINLQYYSHDPVTGQLTPFSCDGTCSNTCIPDTVNVNVTNYEFRRFVSFLRLPPVIMPSFPVSVPMQGAGCDPEQNACQP